MRKVSSILKLGMLCLIWIAFSCNAPGSIWNGPDEQNDEVQIPVNLQIITVSDTAEASAKALDTMPPFSTEPGASAGYINSGSPDYLKIRIYAIVLEYDDGLIFDLWRGEEEIALSDQAIDISLIIADLNPAPSGRVVQVSAEIDPTGLIKGTLTKNFRLTESDDGIEITIHTKQAYSYDAYNIEGGAESYMDFTGGEMEEAEISLGTSSISTPCDYELSDGENPQLTLLFDLSRVLRFYCGEHPEQQGVGPMDLGDKAYFFTHSTFSESAALFFGTAGSIYGFKTIYASYNPEDSIGGVIPAGVFGWMTLIFDVGGNILSGHLIGDDDNALTVAKGAIQSFEVDGNETITFTYIIGNAQGEDVTFTVSGFELLSEIGTFTPVTAFESPDQHGEAVFELQFYN